MISREDSPRPGGAAGRLLSGLGLALAALVVTPAEAEVRHGTVSQLTGNTAYVNLGIPDGLVAGQSCVLRDREGRKLGDCKVGTVYMSRSSIILLTPDMNLEVGYEVDVTVEGPPPDAPVGELRRSTHQEAQRKTLDDIEMVGAAMFRWVTDQLSASGAAAATGTVYRVSDFPEIDYRDLTRLLGAYLETVPPRDGWGNEYEYRLNTDDPLAPAVMLIRSPGFGGRFEADEYTRGVFDAEEWRQDIVWADARWIRRPDLTAEMISRPSPASARARTAP